MGCCNTKIDEKPLCYCFNISENAYIEALKAEKGDVLKSFVVFQTSTTIVTVKILTLLSSAA